MSRLTAAQLAILKADIAVNTQQIQLGTGPVAINASPNTPDIDAEIANQWYNLFPATAFWGNYKTVPLDQIKAAITFKNYTPNDLPPASGGTTQITNDLLNYLARALFTQNLQFNINNLLLVGQSFDATNANLVAGLKDATNTDMPTGVGGAARKGGWATVQTVICRLGRNIEKLFADTSGGNGAANTTAATFTFEGIIDGYDVKAARDLP